MKVREIFNTLFTEYPGHLGFAPAVLTLVVCVAMFATVVYGAATLGKAIIADTPTVETGHS